GRQNGAPRGGERRLRALYKGTARPGRETGRGHGYLQTHQPHHPVMRAIVAGDREAFYATEIEARERTGYPPFGRLASLIISGPDRPSAEGFARRLAGTAPPAKAVRVLGPAEAPIAVIRGRHRFRLLAKAARSFDLSGYVRGWLVRAPKAETGVRVEVDIDPVSFL